MSVELNPKRKPKKTVTAVSRSHITDCKHTWHTHVDQLQTGTYQRS